MKISEMLEIMQIDTTEIFRRADIQQIRSFILDNASVEANDLTYNERLAESNSLMLKRLKKVYKDDENELDNALCDFSTMTSTYRDVFTEIGMKANVRIMSQLLCEDK